ncbi:PEGA domain-containing protein [Paludibaculum fermentans]|uniref:PEGA domain-containing protein n=1 Tax=Paludibaculum fermentans TaxID=1473598 RepID=A0A7S7NS33_PALFE|nr:PEGA domain-containing protein [Paludibaculum fermentans]QOY88805.1 PEGA domain-containing protein [Paludibaculum fermentans]
MTLTNGRDGAERRFGFTMLRKLLLVSAALIVALPASAGVRYVRGGFGFGPAFGPWGYGYDPYFYGGYPMVTHPNAGQVKLDTKIKDAEVFVNGSYAGTVGELKSMWLRQGSYKLEVRAPGREQFAQQIYVVNGKTMKVRPELRMEPKS